MYNRQLYGINLNIILHNVLGIHYNSSDASVLSHSSWISVKKTEKNLTSYTYLMREKNIGEESLYTIRYHPYIHLYINKHSYNNFKYP